MKTADELRTAAVTYWAWTEAATSPDRDQRLRVTSGDLADFTPELLSILDDLDGCAAFLAEVMKTAKTNEDIVYLAGDLGDRVRDRWGDDLFARLGELGIDSAVLATFRAAAA